VFAEVLVPFWFFELVIVRDVDALLVVKGVGLIAGSVVDAETAWRRLGVFTSWYGLPERWA
jgi:hypothetical protein